MIVSKPYELTHANDFILLDDYLERGDFYLKIEGLNIGSSIKIKAAKAMIENFEQQGFIKENTKIIESSSGNLGLSLSIICASKGYKFVCVSDKNISPQTASMIRAYGTELVIIDEKDSNGGYLGKRLEYINKRLENDDNLLWVNQYENEQNILAHYKNTGPEILDSFGKVDYLFIGAGTTGTLGGVSRYIKKNSPGTKIIAVDTLGSVTFNGKPGKRLIPGLGTSKAPPISKHSIYDELVRVEEIQSVRTCNYLASKGLLLGGSTGTILAGVKDYFTRNEPSGNIIAISPDLGDRYLDTIYNPVWIENNFPNYYS